MACVSNVWEARVDSLTTRMHTSRYVDIERVKRAQKIGVLNQAMGKRVAKGTWMVEEEEAEEVEAEMVTR